MNTTTSRPSDLADHKREWHSTAAASCTATCEWSGNTGGSGFSLENASWGSKGSPWLGAVASVQVMPTRLRLLSSVPGLQDGLHA